MAARAFHRLTTTHPGVKHAIMLVPLFVLLAVFMIYPVGNLLLMSFWSTAGLSSAAYQRIFDSSVYIQVIWITLLVSFATTFFALVLAYPIAYLAATSEERRKNRIVSIVLLSFWMSFLVRAFAWVIILGRNGPANHLLLLLGITDRPIDLSYNFTAVLVGMVHAMLPLAILTMLAVMENIDRSLTRAASTLGAKPGKAFWTVYFPLSLPGVAAAGIMVFVTSVGFFIIPALLGGRKEMMISQLIIDQIQQTLNWELAGAISVLLLIVVGVVFFLYDRIFGFSSLTGETAQKHRARDSVWRKMGNLVLEKLGQASDVLLPKAKPRKADSAAPRGLTAVVWALVLLMGLPVLVMIPLSFSSGSLSWPPQHFTLQWYVGLWESPLWSQAFWRSIVVGLGTGTLSMLIGVPAAFVLARGRFRGKALVLTLVLSPILVPRIIIAVGLFNVFAKLGLIGTSIGLIIGHSVVAVPYVITTMTAVLRNYDVRLDAAAQSLGARPFTALRYVTFPILGAGMLSSFLFAFVTSFDELTIALFSSGGLTATLPKQFWDEVTLQVSPTIAAVSTCLLIFVCAIIVAADQLRRLAARGGR